MFDLFGIRRRAEERRRREAAGTVHRGEYCMRPRTDRDAPSKDTYWPGYLGADTAAMLSASCSDGTSSSDGGSCGGSDGGGGGGD